MKNFGRNPEINYKDLAIDERVRIDVLRKLKAHGVSFNYFK